MEETGVKRSDAKDQLEGLMSNRIRTGIARLGVLAAQDVVRRSDSMGGDKQITEDYNGREGELKEVRDRLEGIGRWIARAQGPTDRESRRAWKLASFFGALHELWNIYKHPEQQACEGHVLAAAGLLESIVEGTGDVGSKAQRAEWKELKELIHIKVRQVQIAAAARRGWLNARESLLNTERRHEAEKLTLKTACAEEKRVLRERILELENRVSERLEEQAETKRQERTSTAMCTEADRKDVYKAVAEIVGDTRDQKAIAEALEEPEFLRGGWTHIKSYCKRWSQRKATEKLAMLRGKLERGRQDVRSTESERSEPRRSERVSKKRHDSKGGAYDGESQSNPGEKAADTRAGTGRVEDQRAGLDHTKRGRQQPGGTGPEGSGQLHTTPGWRRRDRKEKCRQGQEGEVQAGTGELSNAATTGDKQRARTSNERLERPDGEYGWWYEVEIDGEMWNRYKTKEKAETRAQEIREQKRMSEEQAKERIRIWHRNRAGEGYRANEIEEAYRFL